jgi:hypothetical protein
VVVRKFVERTWRQVGPKPRELASGWAQQPRGATISIEPWARLEVATNTVLIGGRKRRIVEVAVCLVMRAIARTMTTVGAVDLSATVRHDSTAKRKERGTEVKEPTQRRRCGTRACSTRALASSRLSLAGRLTFSRSAFGEGFNPRSVGSMRIFAACAPQARCLLHRRGLGVEMSGPPAHAGL